MTKHFFYCLSYDLPLDFKKRLIELKLVKIFNYNKQLYVDNFITFVQYVWRKYIRLNRKSYMSFFLR